ncbi:MAG: tyrosine-type recombinase/integrase [Bifidobacterium adolescentis]
MRKQFPAPQWADDINHWLDSLKAAAYSPATLATRRCQLTALSHALDGSPLDVDNDELVDYFASRSWKPETRKSARNAVVSFFRWLQASGKRDDDPSDELPSVRRPQAHPRPCPDRIIIQAMRQADDEERLMLRLGAECGLRRSEIAATSSDDVLDDVGGRSLMVREQGRQTAHCATARRAGR